VDVVRRRDRSLDLRRIVRGERDRARSDAAEPEADRAVRGDAGDTAEREVAVASADLEERVAGGRRERREPHLCQDLVRLESRREVEEEEVLGRDLATPVAALRGHPPAEGAERGGELGCRVRMRERAPDGATVSHDRVRDVEERLADERAEPPCELRSLQPALPRHRADGDPAGALLDVRQLGKPVQVDERRGPCQAHVQERQEALPAGEDRGLVTELGLERERLREGFRDVVLEGGRLHAAPGGGSAGTPRSNIASGGRSPCSSSRRLIVAPSSTTRSSSSPARTTP
jgi:hypothetical protein